MIDLTAPAEVSARSSNVVQTPAESQGFKVPEAPAPSTGDVVDAYWRTETVLGSMMTNAGRQFVGEVDPNFRAWDHIETLSKEDQDLALQYPEAFEGPSSVSRVSHTLATLRQEQDLEYIKSKAGTFQTIAGIGMSFVDVSTLIPFVGGAAKVGLAGRVAIGAANAGLTATAEEAVLQSTQETRTATESAIGIGASFMLGAGLGSFGKIYSTPANVDRLQLSLTESPSELPVVPGMLSGGAAAMDDVTIAAGQGRGIKGALEGSQDINKTVFDKIPVLRQTAGYLSANSKNERVRKFLQMGTVSWGRKAGDMPEETAEEIYNQMEAMGAKSVRAYRDAFSAYDRSKGGAGNAYGVMGSINRLTGRTKASKQEFDQHVAELLEDKSYKTGDAELDKHVASAANAMRPVLSHLFKEASGRGFFKTNKIVELEKLQKSLSDDVAALKAKASEAADLGSKGDLEKVQKKLARAEAKLAKAVTEASNLDNYFTQHWVRSAIQERGLPGPDHAGKSMVEILARGFAKTKAVDEDMILAARRSLGDDTDLDDLMEALADGGLDALPEAYRKNISDNLEAYARKSAEKTVSKFRETGELHLGELANENLEASSRFIGRKLRLDRDTRLELRAAGFLGSDPEVILMQNIRDVGSKVAVHEKFGTVDALNPEKSLIAQQIGEEFAKLEAEGKMTGDEVASEMLVLKNQMARMLNRHTYVDPNGVNWAARNARRFTSTLLLGGAGLSQLSDLFVTSLQMGLTGTLKGVFVRSFTAMPKILKGMNDGQMRALMVGLDSYNGVMRMLDATNMGNPVGNAAARGVGHGLGRKITGRIDETLEGAANLMQFANLQHPMTVMMRVLAFDDLNQLLHKGIANASAISPKQWDRLTRLGLSPDDLDKMAKLPTYEAEGIKLFDTDEWAGLGSEAMEMRRKLLLAVDRNARQSVVQVGRGMTPTFFDNEFAKVVFQFQQFAYGIHETALRGFFKGGVLPKDMQTATALMFGLGVGIGIDMLKEAVKGRDVTPISERFGTPARTFGSIYTAVDRAGLLAFVSPYTQIGMRLLGTATDQDFFGQTGRFSEVDLVGLAGGPTVGTISRASTALNLAANGNYEQAGYQAIRLFPIISNHFATDGAIRRTFGVN